MFLLTWRLSLSWLSALFATASSTCPVTIYPKLAERALGERGDSFIMTTHYMCLLEGNFDRSFLEQMGYENRIGSPSELDVAGSHGVYWCPLCVWMTITQICCSTLDKPRSYISALLIRNAAHSTKYNLAPRSTYARSLGNRVKKELYVLNYLKDIYFLSW